MSDYLIGRDGRLIEVSGNELYHWKYIKKKKINGKWRYYYDKDQLKDDLGFDERDAYKKAKKDLMLPQTKLAAATVNLEDSFRRGFGPNTGGVTSYGKKTYKNVSVPEYLKYDKEYRKAKKKADKALAKYHKTPIGKIEAAIDKGRRFIESLFD